MIEEGWAEVGARIAEVRKMRGYSQDDLASKMGLDRTAISKIEVGRRHISALELVRLAELLERPLQSFVTPPPQAVVSRRAAIAGQRSDRHGDYALEDIARDIALLVDIQALGAHEAKGSLRAIKPGGAGTEAEEAAARARGLMGVDRHAPLLDLADHAERVGLFAFSMALGEAAADGAYVEVDGVGVALVNGDLDAGRRRSTLAHELGHHLFGDAYSADWGSDTSEIERAIDSFAIHLLLPRGGATRRWRELRKEHGLRAAAIIISAEYRVSWTAALRQLRHYELISKEDYRTLDARSPTRADYLECGVRVTAEIEPTYVPAGVSAAAIKAYRTYLLSAERVTELLRGQVSIDDLGLPDKIPLDALRGELS
ncbi:helix-turn-helix domain-containing protein [Actinomadura adrarensis]|uniref:Helix-turn-helix domain-containing protein n=1 Tax=Actinomadura adrarensis TaxID=1819600 RepID=A0ABW3CTQ4_9ACTN